MLLNAMRRLAGGQLGNYALQNMFLDKMPEHISILLSAEPDIKLDKLAARADHIMDAARPQVAHISTEAPFKEHIEAFNRGPPRKGSTQNNWRPAPSNKGKRNDRSGYVCFYHRRFGYKARNCEDKCAFKPRQPVAIGSLSDGSTSNLLTISDKFNQLCFLVDTGAEISVLPKMCCKGFSKQTNCKLHAANGTSIKTFGTKSLTLDLGLQKPFRWEFCVADVEQPSIGADFLKSHNLPVNLNNRRLRNMVSLHSSDENTPAMPTKFDDTTSSRTTCSSTFLPKEISRRPKVRRWRGSSVATHEAAANPDRGPSWRWHPQQFDEREASSRF
ncbi:uncharacterized protein LOC107271987 [Cephus cinctus]|uniref:Uncharacterized protein LOC107271987 n=1 Tax=Cephus cinctus TaxID=211228 RepID=A0AAJ7C7W8_CEPCN|nr:uncharacterized protein LOC107271987 [Cephus cinctus]